MAVPERARSGPDPAAAVRADPGVEEGAFETQLSQLRQAAAERDRLERVLLALAGTFADDGRAHALEALLDAARELSAARLAAYLPADRSQREIVRGPGGDVVGRLRMLDRVGVFAPAHSGETVHVSDVTRTVMGADRGVLQITIDGRLMRSWLALPVGIPDEDPMGILFLAHHRAQAFSPRRVALATAISSLAGHELDAARTVEEQGRISNALQSSLLPPSLPRLDGLDLAACYRPSGYGNLVGGDFYDVFPNQLGGWDLLLGDVSGVGPEAAGLAGVVRYTARALGESTASTAPEILGQVNAAVLRAASLERFCSAVLARLSREGDGVEVELASAGHPAPFLLRAGGEVAHATSATGTILGVIDEARIGESRFRLAPGDALVCFTDGVLEARSVMREQFGEERVARALGGARGRSAAGIARRLERAVLDHRGQANTDDVAIFVVRATGST